MLFLNTLEGKFNIILGRISCSSGGSGLAIDSWLDRSLPSYTSWHARKSIYSTGLLVCLVTMDGKLVCWCQLPKSSFIILNFQYMIWFFVNFFDYNKSTPPPLFWSFHIHATVFYSLQKEEVLVINFVLYNCFKFWGSVSMDKFM